MSDNIRPEVKALIERGNVTLEEWRAFRGNSWEQEAILPALTNEAIAHVARHIAENCRANTRRPCVTYNDAVPVVLVPELLRRLELKGLPTRADHCDNCVPDSCLYGAGNNCPMWHDPAKMELAVVTRVGNDVARDAELLRGALFTVSDNMEVPAHLSLSRLATAAALTAQYKQWFERAGGEAAATREALATVLTRAESAETAAARVPGLEAEVKRLEERCKVEITKALTAESERDAARQEAESAKGELALACESLAECAILLVGEKAGEMEEASDTIPVLVAKAVKQRDALTARVAWLEREVAEMHGQCEAHDDRARKAEARATAAEARTSPTPTPGSEWERRGTQTQRVRVIRVEHVIGSTRRDVVFSILGLERPLESRASMARFVREHAPAPTPAPGLRRLEASQTSTALDEPIELLIGQHMKEHGTTREQATWAAANTLYEAYRSLQKKAMALRERLDLNQES